MPLTRTPHWATREFNQFLLDQEKVPFQWGVSDCCLMAANAIQSFTGTDLADDFRGHYSDDVGAFALIRKLTGGSTVEDAAAYCAAKHGLVEWRSPLLAQRGDLVVLLDAGQLVAGVVHLNGRHIITIGARGLKRFPLTAAKRAWKV